jgi:hypothetical protein
MIECIVIGRRCTCRSSLAAHAGGASRAVRKRPCHGRVIATAGLVAVAATHRLPPRTCRRGWSRRVPMLYGTRRGSRPALLPCVCGVTWEFVTRYGALDGRAGPCEGDSDLRAARPDDVAITITATRARLRAPRKAVPHNSPVDASGARASSRSPPPPCDEAQPSRNRRRTSALDTVRRQLYSPRKPKPGDRAFSAA